MTDHPIIPPSELIKPWWKEAQKVNEPDIQCWVTHVAVRAAQWGADQELEACVKLLELSDKNARDFLYSARRPKPLSLKQQGLQALGRFTSNAHTNGDEMMRDFDLIRQALQEIKGED